MRKSSSVSLPLALRFMLLLAAAMLSLSLLFVALLRHSVARAQDAELEKSISLIAAALRSRGADELAFIEIPYFIAYAVWEVEDGRVLATNDALLPLLDSGGKSRTHFEKDFFTDSDLLIRYRTERLDLGGKTLAVECALDIANDSAAQMSRSLPRIVLLSLVPALLFSFALSFLISRQTIREFKKLQADYDREKAFTSNVSHELKTPISIISGHAGLLRRWGKDDPAQLSESIDAILRETENMGAVVETLLAMSRIENGTVSVAKEKCSAADLFARLADEFSVTHPGMTFAISDPDSIEIETDRQKVHQIFTVVLSNSAKFAGERCAISLCARKAGGRTELSAADDGPGFPEEAIPHVFERFYKGDLAHTRNAGGAGLGLSIAKSLADALGISIRAENAKNGGAMVVVTL